MRLLVVLALLVPRLASAKLMPHTDLAGLVLESEAVVIADRTEGTPAHFHVTSVLRGALAVGSELDLDDQLYRDPDHTFDKRVWLFIRRDGGAPAIVPSGMRLTSRGKVFRFEQFENPGGWTAMVQGVDPADQWRGGTAIDVPEFERELAAAIRRADGLDAALKEPDRAKRRAALLALLAPAGDERATGGFYRDVLAQRVETALAKAGDIEGALMAVAHDHSAIVLGRELGTPAQLLALGADTAKPAAIRIAALDAIAQASGSVADEPTLRGLMAQFSDPSSRVRAAAIATAGQMVDWIPSKPDARLHGLRGELRDRLLALARTETANVALYALAVALERGHVRFPARKGPAYAAVLAVSKHFVEVDVACLRGAKGVPYRLVATHDGQPFLPGPSVITLRCGETTREGSEEAFPLGATEISVEVMVGDKPVVVRVGSVAASPNGELAIAQE